MPRRKLKIRKVNPTSIKSVPKGSFKLPIQTVTFIPSTTKTNKKISASIMRARVNLTRRFLSKLFGGFTSVNATGGFVSKDGKLVREKVVKITAFAERVGFIAKKNKWLAFVKLKKKQWSQEAMGIIIENDLFFI